MKPNKAILGRPLNLGVMFQIMIIIAVVNAAIMPKLIRYIPWVQTKRAISDIKFLGDYLQLYYHENGIYPSTQQELKALLEKPTIPPIPKNWIMPYARALPVDPWNHSYRYRCPGVHNPNDYDLWSAGKDGISGTPDDITNWNNPTTSH